MIHKIHVHVFYDECFPKCCILKYMYMYVVHYLLLHVHVTLKPCTSDMLNSCQTVNNVYTTIFFLWGKY